MSVFGKSKSKAPSPFNKEQGICRDASGAVIPCEEGGLVRKKASPPNEGGGPEEADENQKILKGAGHIHKDDPEYAKKVKRWRESVGTLVAALVLPGGMGLKKLRDMDMTPEGVDHDPDTTIHDFSKVGKGMLLRERNQRARDAARRKGRGAYAVPRGQGFQSSISRNFFRPH